MAQAKQKKRFDFNAYIANEAINFDKASWNRKYIYLAISLPIAILLSCFRHMAQNLPPDGNYKIFEESLNTVVLGIPILYFCARGYVFSMFLAVALFWDANWSGKTFIPVFFYISALIEMYRNNQGMAKPKNWKKDFIIALILDSFFIYGWLWIYVPLWWQIICEGQVGMILHLI